MTAVPLHAASDDDGPDAPGGALVWLPWVVRLRWAAVAGQLLTVAAARLAFGLPVPTLALLGVVAFTAASNVGAGWLGARTRATSALVALLLCLDVVLFTLLLGLTGGPANPFSVLYLVHVSLAALVFGLRWSIALAGLCAAAYATLFFWHVPIAWDHGAHAHHAGHGGGAIGLHLQGMWAATALAAAIIGYFVSRTAAALRAREAEVRRLARAAARDERLVALSALAAGAAHELGSPLATIAVAARELERRAEGAPFAADARLIRAEVERCRQIVLRMSGQAGAEVGEALEAMALGEVLRQVERELEPTERARLHVEPAAPGASLRAPRAALARALASLVRNGLAASPTSPVSLRGEAVGDAVRFEVRDEGVGMTPEVLARVGEPFFTTRSAGEGMGLGVFLARAIAEHLGGRLRLDSQPGRGTRAILEVSRDPLGGAGG